MLLVGRMVFAGAMIGFGALCLVFVDFVHQLQPVDLVVSRSSTGYGVFAVLTGLLLIACGLAIVSGFRMRAAGLVIAVMFLASVALLQVPSAFLNPELLRSPWWVRTFEEVVLAGAALILAGLASEPVRDRWVHAGRVMMGVSLPVFGILHLVYAGSTARLVPSFYPWPVFWIYLTALGNLAAGAALVTGIRARLAGTLVAAMYGTYVATLHIPLQALERGWGDRAGMTSLFVAIGFSGAGLIVAGSLAEESHGTQTSNGRS